MHRKIKSGARQTRGHPKEQIAVAEKTIAQLERRLETERERELLKLLLPAISLLYEIVPLAEAYIRENLLEDSSLDKWRKFVADYERYRTKSKAE